jgi:hypothetical protein
MPDRTGDIPTLQWSDRDSLVPSFLHRRVVFSYRKLLCTSFIVHGRLPQSPADLVGGRYDRVNHLG